MLKCINLLLYSMLLIQCSSKKGHVIPNNELEKWKIKRNVKYPKQYHLRSYRKIQFTNKHFYIKIFSEEFSQGKAAYIEIIPKVSIYLRTTQKLNISYSQKKIYLVKRQWGYRGLFGFSNKGSFGKKNIQVSYIKDGKNYFSNHSFSLKETKYPTYRWKSFVKKVSYKPSKANPDITQRKEIESTIKSQVYSQHNQNFLSRWMSHPRDFHQVTSSFWSKRIIKRYTYKNQRRIKLPPKIYYHKGLDLKSPTGSPIYAILRGLVVIAKKMHFEGGFTVLDHGNKIFSGYMHQSKILIDEGDIVEAGELIGKSGASGATTGPHLHVFLRINNTYVHPLSVLPLPIRE